MVTEAVNVTLVPAQMLLPWLETIEAVGAALLFTVIVIALLTAVAGLGQLRLLVIWQVTVWPLVSEDVTYVALFVPAGDPSTNHW